MVEDMCYADETFGLQQLYEQVNNGPGVAAVEPAVAALRRSAQVYAGSAERLQRAIQGTGSTWRGQAASATAGGLTTLARWADRSGESHGSGVGRVQGYADSFAELKSKVAKPEPVPTLSSWGSFWEDLGVTSDHTAAIQRNQQAAAAAYDALAAHERNAHSDVAGFPGLDPVPAATSAAENGTGPQGGGRASGGGPPSVGWTPTASPDPGAPAGGGTPGPPTSTETSASPGPATPPGTPGGLAAPTTGPGGGPDRLDPPTGGFVPPTTSSRPADPFPRAGRSDGHRPGLAPEPRAASPAPAPRGGPGAEAAGPMAAGPAGAGGRGGVGTGMGGMPIGAGVGARARETQHRNQYFLPSDEAFVVDDLDIVPSVLGAEDAEDEGEER